MKAREFPPSYDHKTSITYKLFMLSDASVSQADMKSLVLYEDLKEKQAKKDNESLCRKKSCRKIRLTA